MGGLGKIQRKQRPDIWVTRRQQQEILRREHSDYRVTYIQVLVKVSRRWRQWSFWSNVYHLTMKDIINKFNNKYGTNLIFSSNTQIKKKFCHRKISKSWCFTLIYFGMLHRIINQLFNDHIWRYQDKDTLRCTDNFLNL